MNTIDTKADPMGWAVVQHSSGPAGGWVVRPVYATANGPWMAAPYSGVTPERVYKRRHAAQNRADKLNGYG